MEERKMRRAICLIMIMMLILTAFPALAEKVEPGLPLQECHKSACGRWTPMTITWMQN